ncbi:MAG: GNAT family N-acetyltransferase [Phycisphaerales bacterium]|nr:GNAT family N-acetyltransferase [Phycisphaerales bacterium]
MEKSDSHHPTPRPSPTSVRLRPTTASDLPALHAMELDPLSNERAGSKPRDWPTFLGRWEQILADPSGVLTGVTPRVILADGELVGSVNVSPQDGVSSLGYWIARDHWGRGIATRAVALMLVEYPARPLIATAAAFNLASIRVLEKNGFVIASRHATPEGARTVERETVTLVLR